MFSCIHELSPYHYQLSSCHHQLSSWYYQFSSRHHLDLCTWHITDNVNGAIFQHFAKYPLSERLSLLCESQRLFAKYIGQYRLLLCENFEKKLQCILVTAVCLSVCLSVCLQRLYRSHGWSDRPDFFCKRCRLDTRQCRTFFFENPI